MKSGGVNVYYTWKDTAYDSSSCSYSDKYVTIYPTQGAKSASANITVTGGTGAGRELYVCPIGNDIYDAAGNYI